jgi:beta-glucosidase
MKLFPHASSRRFRRRFPRTTVAAGFVAVALPVVGSIAPVLTVSPAGSSCPWLNPSLSVSQRVGMLLPRMSLADKLDMLAGTGAPSMMAGVVTSSPVRRLCIPAMGLQDGPNGVGDGQTGVTQLPAGVSLAATWDTSLATAYGQVVGAEERAKGATVNLGPTVNIDRDPRWGRSFEAYTEDPDLNAALAVADIDGVQSQGVLSQVKHFAVYNQETSRNTPADDAIVSERAIHEIYLPAFWAAVNVARTSSAMCSYSTVNGQPACQSQYLIDTTLDQRWAFPGFVTSDYGATHSTAASAEAGLDQEMPTGAYYGPALAAAVTSGRVAMDTLDTMVTRILTEMFRFNDFNDPSAGSASAVVTTPAHQAVSTAVAEAGTVLLKTATVPCRCGRRVGARWR